MLTAEFIKRMGDRINRHLAGEFADSMANIIATQASVAARYFDDGSIAQACPPLRALMHLMRDGHYEEKQLNDPGIRALFDRNTVLASDWYRARLQAKQAVDIGLWQRHAAYLEKFLQQANYAGEAARLGIADRLVMAQRELQRVAAPGYVAALQGTIGAEPAIAAG